MRQKSAMHNTPISYLEDRNITVFLEKFDDKIEQKLKDSEHKYSEPLEESKEATKEANQFIHKQLTGNQ